MPLTPRPFDLLVALLERAGRLVDKGELMRLVWPDTAVEENNLNQCVSAVRKALGDGLDGARYVETVPRRGYRFVAEVRLQEASTAAPAPAGRPARGSRTPAFILGGAALAALLAAAAFAWLRAARQPRLAPKDTVVIADFTNATGEPVFDETLRQALAIQLERSPFLNVLSEERVDATLKLMNRRPGERVARETALEICRRTNSKAVLAGSIASLGSRYLIALQASSCLTGDSLGGAEAEAEGRERVIRALGEASAGLRRRLGESLPALDTAGQRLDEATTSSLEALQAFTRGARAAREQGNAEALPDLERAVQLDPGFARAWATLGTVHMNLGQATRAMENYRRAFDLRERVSERERLSIEGMYYLHVTGEMHRAVQAFRDHVRSYPDDAEAHNHLCTTLFQLGQWDRSAPECQEALRLNPDNGLALCILMADQLGLGRVDEAAATYRSWSARRLDHGFPEALMYLVSFARGDAAGMRRHFEAVQGKPGFEDLLLTMQSDTEAHHGRLRSARAYSARAVAAARRSGAAETALLWQAYGALHEAELGEAAEAGRQAESALREAAGRDVRALATLTLARAGRLAEAERLAEALDREFPLDTLMQGYVLPTIRGSIALRRGQPAAALEALAAAAPYEHAAPQAFYYTEPPLYPVYVRGQAYLAARQPAEAAAEFARMLRHRWMSYPLGALARLQLARARAMSGDRAGAAAAYEEFLARWKDADPDLPALREARAEHRRLLGGPRIVP